MSAHAANPTHVAIVTGSGGALGGAIVATLREAGMNVFGTDLPGRGGGEEFIAADVTDEGQVIALFAEARRRAGRPVTVLVNNAGIARAQNILEMELADWEEIMRVNLRSVFLCTREFLRRFSGESGRVVSISSISGQQGAVYGHAHYSASKAGIIGFTKAVARTAAPMGVTVNCVAPGVIDTPLVQATHGPGQSASLAASIPLGLGTPADVGASVAYLCSPAARYMTGATLDLNGGLYFR